MHLSCIRTVMIRHLLILPLFVALVGLTGCGPGKPKTIPVNGKVTLDGKAVAKGSVMFHPDESKGNKSKHVPVGNINGGDYLVATGADSGAPAGWYKVTVTASVPSNPKDEYSVPISLVPEVYNDAKKTTLVVEVKEGAAPGAYDLKLSK